jgi:hypothetical protein
VVERDDRIFVDPGSYDRYDRFLEELDDVDPGRLAVLLETVDPLVEKALTEIGVEAPPGEVFETAIEELLAVPALEGDGGVERVQPNVRARGERAATLRAMDGRAEERAPVRRAGAGRDLNACGPAGCCGCARRSARNPGHTSGRSTASRCRTARASSPRSTRSSSAAAIRERTAHPDEHDAWCVAAWLAEMDRRGRLDYYFNPSIRGDMA